MTGPDGEAVTVVLGNASPKDKAAREAMMAGPRGGVVDTVVKVSPVSDLRQAFAEIVDGQGLWVHHSDEPPTFVESNSDALALLVSEHYGCPIGRQRKKK